MKRIICFTVLAFCAFGDLAILVAIVRSRAQWSLVGAAAVLAGLGFGMLRILGWV